MKSFRFALLAPLLLLAACASNPLVQAASAQTSSVPAQVSDPVAQLATFTVADLQSADADAVANHDAIAHACYPSLIMFIQSLPSSNGGTTVVGAFSAFQKARDFRNIAAGGVPDYLTMGCGPLYAQVHGDILNFLARGAVSAALPAL